MPSHCMKSVQIRSFFVFFWSVFPVLGLNTGKYRLQKTLYLDIFHVVLVLLEKLETVDCSKRYANRLLKKTVLKNHLDDKLVLIWTQVSLIFSSINFLWAFVMSVALSGYRRKYLSNLLFPVVILAALLSNFSTGMSLVFLKHNELLLQ